jgi:hypothetical protein
MGPPVWELLYHDCGVGFANRDEFLYCIWVADGFREFEYLLRW